MPQWKGPQIRADRRGTVMKERVGTPSSPFFSKRKRKKKGVLSDDKEEYRII